MDKTMEVIRFTIKEYPYDDLMRIRLEQMVKAVDRLSEINTGHQLTVIDWDNLDTDINDYLNRDKIVVVLEEESAFGVTHKVVRLTEKPKFTLLTDDEKELILKVINDTCDLSYVDFVEYVFNVKDKFDENITEK